MSKEFNFYELKAADRLPSPSGIALAVMRLVQRDDATAQQVAQLLQTDPALSGRVLAFANSAAFGARRPVVNIQDAVVQIGMSTVRNIVLSLSLVGKHRAGSCAKFDYESYWSRSLMLAVVLSGIIARNRTTAPEEAFTLGLLAEIGRLALATAWPEEFSELLVRADGSQLLLLEQGTFAVDHEALGLMLLADWGFPVIFLDALKISCQLSTDQSDTSRTAQLSRQLIFANHITDYCLTDLACRDEVLLRLEEEALGFSLDSGAFTNFVNNLVSQWQDFGKLIGINAEIPIFEPQIPTLTEPAFSGLDVLLVDDDPMMLSRLTKQLANSGHRIQVCSDGESALKQVIEQNVQLMITDWRMKPMDGVQLCKALRASVIGKNIYIIMLTATENEEALVEAFDAGIDDYVIKPVSLRVLLARIRAGQRIINLQQDLLKERKELERSTAELAKVNRRLQHLAHTDLLTALPNRRYALMRLEQEWSATQRFNRPLSVLMLDLDFFKLINDSAGHDVGDQVLAHTAKIMRETIRTNDVACRLGGEEFLIIAPNTDSAAALLLAERIRQTTEARQLSQVTLPQTVTVSIGVSSSTDCKSGWGELVKMADRAVYQAKEKGRNRVQAGYC
jgi:diguanylate cyclase (GGDEF)-like protein